MTDFISVSEIRARMSSAIVTALSDYRISRHAYEDFPRAETRQIVHKSFAVHFPNTAPDPLDVRQYLAKGSMVNTAAQVRVAYRIKADSSVTDTDLALDAEHEVIKALLTTSRAGGLTIRFEAVDTRRVLDSIIHLSDLRFRLIHRFALS